MELTFKVVGVSKNVVRLEAKPHTSADALKPSGSPTYGELNVIVADQKQLDLIKVGSEVDVTIDFPEPEEEAEEEKV